MSTLGTRSKPLWVLKFEDGEYLYNDGEWPKWGKKRKQAFRFKTRKEARRVRKTWPKWCRASIKIMRLSGITKVERVNENCPGTDSSEGKLPEEALGKGPGDQQCVGGAG